MITQETSVKANDDGLLNKENVLLMLTGIRSILDNGNELTQEENEFVFDLDALIVKTNCCIYAWKDLAELYLEIYCTMKGISVFFQNGYHDLLIGYLGFLDAAHKATKPHVTAKDKEGLARLGFGKKQVTNE